MKYLRPHSADRYRVVAFVRGPRSQALLGQRRLQALERLVRYVTGGEQALAARSIDLDVQITADQVHDVDDVWENLP